MIGAGVVTLLGQFTEVLFLSNISKAFVQWAGILFSFALVLGLVNLLAVHVRRMRERAEGWHNSLVLIGTVFVVLCAGLNGVNSPSAQWLFQNVQAPLESTMLSLLVFFIVTATVRALRLRDKHRRGSVLMFLTATVVLLGQMPFADRLGREFVEAQQWLMNVPMVAGMRGILLCVALGAMATGLRILFGVEREKFFH